ncbi:MAG: hypothetical protein WCD63_02520, partial [Terrimicrobiaceae bacterium]
GISVDSAVDIAKAAAAVILLEKDLMVLQAGVIDPQSVDLSHVSYYRGQIPYERPSPDPSR